MRRFASFVDVFRGCAAAFLRSAFCFGSFRFPFAFAFAFAFALVDLGFFGGGGDKSGSLSSSLLLPVIALFAFTNAGRCVRRPRTGDGAEAVDLAMMAEGDASAEVLRLRERACLVDNLLTGFGVGSGGNSPPRFGDSSTTSPSSPRGNSPCRCQCKYPLTPPRQRSL